MSELKLPYDHKELPERLKMIKSESELKEFIASWYKENKDTVPDEQMVNGWIADYLADNPIDGVSEEDIQAAVDVYIKENPVTGVTSEDVENAVNTYLKEHPVSDGKDGVSPTVEVKENADGYTITITDANQEQTFDITNGKDGNPGQDGSPGQDGEPGEAGKDGVGITSIKKTSTSGLVDTYTITFTDGNTTTFTVTNGKDGEGGSGSIANPLTDMNIVTMGDSLTDTRVNGKWIAPFTRLANPKSINNYGRGNCTWTFKNDSEYNDTDISNQSLGNNVIWNQYNRLKKDIDNGDVEIPDLIIIMAGTNDVIQGKVLGTPSNVFLGELSNDITTLTTLSQSIRYTVNAIYDEYPNAKIILVTPPTLAGTSSNYLSLLEVRKCIKECAGFLGVDVVDTEKAGIMYHREVANQYFLMSDKVHLTDIGGEVIANCIYDGIISTPDIIAKVLYDVSNPVITIEKIGIESITLSGNSTVSESNTITIGYTFSPNNSNNYNLVWSSEDTDVATVLNGKVTGISAGNTTIILTDTVSGVSASKDIEVTELTGTIYSVTNNLTNVTTSNSDTNIAENSTYSATLTPDNGCSVESVTVTMGGVDVTSSVYSNGTILIPTVTGNIVIAVVATSNSALSGTIFYGSKLSDVGLNDVSSALPYIVMYYVYRGEGAFDNDSEAGQYKILMFSDTTITHNGNTSVFTQIKPTPTYELYYAKDGDTEFKKATSNTLINEVFGKIMYVDNIVYSSYDVMKYGDTTTIFHAKNYNQSDYE